MSRARALWPTQTKQAFCGGQTETADNSAYSSTLGPSKRSLTVCEGRATALHPVNSSLSFLGNPIATSRNKLAAHSRLLLGGVLRQQSKWSDLTYTTPVPCQTGYPCRRRSATPHSSQCGLDSIRASHGLGRPD